MQCDTTAVAVATSFLTRRDEILLANRSDMEAVNDSLAFSIQSAASISNMSRRLLARTNEVQALKTQAAVLHRMLEDSCKKIRELKEENKQLKSLTNTYARTMLAGLETSGDQIREGHERLMTEVQKLKQYARVD